MELSNYFSLVAKFFCKENFPATFEVNLHQTTKRRHNTLVVLRSFSKSEILKGSGEGHHLADGFLKAMIELGELQICRQFSLKNREGLAGGLFKKTALERAKCELIERDAFLFHFCNGIPFIELPYQDREIVLYQLLSATPKRNVILATLKQNQEGKADCVQLGLGCSQDIQIAINKSLSELERLRYQHLYHLDFCEDSHQSNRPKNNTDFHHQQSRNQHLISYFSFLCQTSQSSIHNRPVINEAEWKYETVKGPFHLIKYFKVTHPHLEAISWGRPEEVKGVSSGFYAPLW